MPKRTNKNNGGQGQGPDKTSLTSEKVVKTQDNYPPVPARSQTPDKVVKVSADSDTEPTEGTADVSHGATSTNHSVGTSLSGAKSNKRKADAIQEEQTPTYVDDEIVDYDESGIDDDDDALFGEDEFLASEATHSVAKVVTDLKETDKVAMSLKKSDFSFTGIEDLERNLLRKFQALLKTDEVVGVLTVTDALCNLATFFDAQSPN